MTRLYYHDHHDHDNDWDIIVILLVIVGVWWGLIHFLDWTTFDFIPWWAEPFTILILIPYLILYVEYGANPLTWWPLVWGTRVNIEGNDFMSVWHKEEAWQKYGGPLNVYYNSEYIKFRRRRDAVTFCLFQKNF